MEVFRYKVDGAYELKASTNDILPSWYKFRARIPDHDTYCSYQMDGEGTLYLYDYASKTMREMDSNAWSELPPVFFETNNYNFTIFFEDLQEGTYPHVIHPDKRVSEMFTLQQIGNKAFLNGAINFLNEPGHFDLKFAYTPANGRERIAEVSFDVVSPKLDTKNDLKIIIQQIRAEYDDIVFRYLTLTYQQFAEGREANNDIIWLAVFKNVIEGYINSVRYIIHRPHFRNHHYVDYLKAERIKKWTPRLSDRFVNDWSEDEEKALKNLYRVERQETTEDTRENRFVKYTLERMGDRLKTVLKKIKINSGDQVSDEENQGLDIYIRQLEKLRCAPLFKNIGRFDGFRQESIVMQQRTGYSQVYRYWLMLQNGLNLIDGKTSVGVLPIWQLYEVWCFLKMKRMVCQILDLDPHNPEDIPFIHEDKETMLNPFLGSEMEDKVLMENKETGDMIELGYQYRYTRTKSGVRDDVHSVTAEQKPDIVLNVKKKGNDILLTYLFDAKYRVKGDDDPTIDEKVSDYPVEDTLNQMHRYRDAIYYGFRSTGDLAKEVIGAYILFPGRMNEDAELEKIANKDYTKLPYFLKSIYQVNIGAYPLLPNDGSGLLLYNRLYEIIKGMSVIDQLRDSVPQRGLFYEEGTPVYMMIKASNMYNSMHIDDIKNGIPFKFRTDIDKVGEDVNIGKVKYIALILENKIQGYYEVKFVNSVSNEKTVIEFDLYNYRKLDYTVDATAMNDTTASSLSYEEFTEYCKGHKIL
jgi:predicted component of viral defense system (DUF524 family)